MRREPVPQNNDDIFLELRQHAHELEFFGGFDSQIQKAKDINFELGKLKSLSRKEQITALKAMLDDARFNTHTYSINKGSNTTTVNLIHNVICNLEIAEGYKSDFVAPDAEEGTKNALSVLRLHLLKLQTNSPHSQTVKILTRFFSDWQNQTNFVDAKNLINKVIVSLRQLKDNPETIITLEDSLIELSDSMDSPDLQKLRKYAQSLRNTDDKLSTAKANKIDATLDRIAVKSTPFKIRKLTELLGDVGLAKQRRFFSTSKTKSIELVEEAIESLGQKVKPLEKDNLNKNMSEFRNVLNIQNRLQVSVEDITNISEKFKLLSANDLIDNRNRSAITEIFMLYRSILRDANALTRLPFTTNDKPNVISSMHVLFKNIKNASQDEKILLFFAQIEFSFQATEQARDIHRILLQQNFKGDVANEMYYQFLIKREPKDQESLSTWLTNLNLLASFDCQKAKFLYQAFQFDLVKPLHNEFPVSKFDLLTLNNNDCNTMIEIYINKLHKVELLILENKDILNIDKHKLSLNYLTNQLEAWAKQGFKNAQQINVRKKIDEKNEELITRFNKAIRDNAMGTIPDKLIKLKSKYPNALKTIENLMADNIVDAGYFNKLPFIPENSNVRPDVVKALTNIYKYVPISRRFFTDNMLAVKKELMDEIDKCESLVNFKEIIYKHLNVNPPNTKEGKLLVELLVSLYPKNNRQECKAAIMQSFSRNQNESQGGRRKLKELDSVLTQSDSKQELNHNLH